MNAKICNIEHKRNKDHDKADPIRFFSTKKRVQFLYHDDVPQYAQIRMRRDAKKYIIQY